MKTFQDRLSLAGIVEFQTSAEQREEFFRSKMWQDISGFIETLLIDTRDYLEDSSGELSGIETQRARGRAEAMRAFLKLPTYMQD